MRKGIHPDYKPTRITCGCGEVIETRSTVESITIEICSSCHPFYTGKQRLVDTAGRVEKFQRRYAWSDDSAKQAATNRRRKKVLQQTAPEPDPQADPAQQDEGQAPPQPEAPSEP